MPIPKSVDRSKVVAILTGSNSQVPNRVWMQDGHLLATRAILDTRSVVSLIREDLLPKEVTVCPLDKFTPGVVRIWFLGRYRIRIHADPSYLITDNSLS